MKFIKKYSALLIPAAIAFAALLLFVPTILTGSSIEQDMQLRLSQSNKVPSLVKKTPSSRQPEQEKVYTGSHAADAMHVEQLAKQSTQRQLLAYGIFPRPQSQSPQLFDKFGEKIRTALKELVKSMGALDAPTEAEIRKETGRGRTTSRRPGRGMLSGSRLKEDVIVDAFCGKRAEDVPVYANPNIFEWYDFWEDYKYDGFELAIEDCWYSQLAYWIYEDVVDTIRMMNTGSDCVYTSPVKRLIGISFSGPADYVKPKSKSSVVNDGDRPQYIPNTSSQVLGVRPWTLRVCNDDIDIMHFSVAMIVGSKAVMPFMKELCSEKEHTFRVGYTETGAEKTYKHNQITILQSEVEPIERDDSVHENYRYGDGAIVRLNFVCEYVLYRNGYDMIKPETIKILLNQEDAKSKAGTSTGNRKPPKKANKLEDWEL